MQGNGWILRAAMAAGMLVAAPRPPTAWAPDAAREAEAVKLAPPALKDVRWQTFDVAVDYVTVDAAGRAWFLVKDEHLQHPQYVCHDAPGLRLALPQTFRSLGADAIGGLWVACPGELWRWDPKTGKRTSKPLEGLFPAGGENNWPTVHPGQVWLGHSAGRVYCHGPQGVHVLAGEQWSYHAWPADALPAAGAVDLAKAGIRHVEGPDGLVLIYGQADALGGFWTHDGRIWRHYSSRRNRTLAGLTAVLPWGKGHSLVCTADGDAFVLDLASSASVTPPKMADILAQLVRLDSTDPAARAEAERAVVDMALAAGEKVAEAAGFLADDALRRRAEEVIRQAGARRRQVEAGRPPSPKQPLRSAVLVARTRQGDALLEWKHDQQKRLGVLRPDGTVVATAPDMLVQFRGSYDESVLVLPDGRMLILAINLWLWEQGKFRHFIDEVFDLDGKVLGMDRQGRLFFELIDQEYRRVKLDGRFGSGRGKSVSDFVQTKKAEKK